VASWDVYYSKDGIEPSPMALPKATTTNKYYTLTGINSDSAYTVWVRLRCNSGAASTTDWTEMLTFKALCKIVSTFPFKEGFNGGQQPDCWVAPSNGTGWSFNTTYDYDYNPTNPIENNGFAYLMPYTVSNQLYNPYALESGAFNLGTTPKRLKFNYWIGKDIVANDSIPLTLEISTDNGVSFTLLKAFHTPKTSKWQYQMVDLAAYDTTNNTRWVPIMDSTNLVAEIRGNGNNLGNVSGAYYRHTTGTVRTANSAYLNRNIAFTVDKQPTTPVSVRIYITAAEWNALAAIYPNITPSSFSLHRVQGVICSNVYIGGTMQEIINGATRNNFGSDYYLEYQTPGFSQFFMTAPNAPIPVELKSFTAVAKDKVNAIQWQTATELNVAKFIVERSNNGATHWLSIGEEKIVGNSTNLQTYNLTDNNPLSMSYYRLQTIDVNGKKLLSNVVSVARKVRHLNITNVFPVPTSNDVNVQFEAKNNEQVTLTITTITGQVVHQSKVTAKEGFNTQTILMTNFENGLYFMSLSNGVDKVLHRIVKQ
jgi:Secretion system C-terminal sorting domain